MAMNKHPRLNMLGAAKGPIAQREESPSSRTFGLTMTAAALALSTAADTLDLQFKKITADNIVRRTCTGWRDRQMSRFC
jgi:hypothetical protein